jgi:hypothetical protein
MSKHKKSQKKEILWNIINSGLAGVLVLLGALTTGEISQESFCIALLTAGIVAITQFKEYWGKEEQEYRTTKVYGLMKLM